MSIITTRHEATMPLLVPGINTSLGEQSEWINKLMGKKLTEETTDVNVSNPSEAEILNVD